MDKKKKKLNKLSKELSNVHRDVTFNAQTSLCRMSRNHKLLHFSNFFYPPPNYFYDHLLANIKQNVFTFQITSYVKMLEE